jgi:hypothetical protein
MLDCQLVYPLIFWPGSGGCGILESERPQGAATKCFAISTQLGPPMFFLTFTMNPYWTNDQVLKPGESLFADSAMATIIFKTKISALMKFIQKNDIMGNVSALCGESSTRNEVFHMLASFLERF